MLMRCLISPDVLDCKLTVRINFQPDALSAKTVSGFVHVEIDRVTVPGTLAFIRKVQTRCLGTIVGVFFFASPAGPGMRAVPGRR